MSPKRSTSRARVYHAAARKCRLESLEDRRMLAVIGSWQRGNATPGEDNDVFADGASFSWGTDGFDLEEDQAPDVIPDVWDDLLVQVGDSTSVQIPGGTTSGIYQALASINVDVGEWTDIPTVHAVASAGAVAGAQSDNAVVRSGPRSSAEATGEFTFVDEDPNDQFVPAAVHGFVFFAIPHIGTRSGDAGYQGDNNVSATVTLDQQVIGSFGASSTFGDNLGFFGSYDIVTINGDESPVQVGLLYFTAPAGNGSTLTINVSASADSEAGAWHLPDGGMANAHADAVIGVWAFMSDTTVPPGPPAPPVPPLPEPEDPFPMPPFEVGEAPGDLNGDGTIDALDYAAWMQYLNKWTTGQQTPLIVTTEADESDGNYTYGDLSLREAIALAANNTLYPGSDTIVFAPWVDTINLNSMLTLHTPVTIVGPGADKLTISGQNLYTIMNVQSTATVTIRGMRLTNGFSGDVGGIKSSGFLTIDQCQIDNNRGYTAGAIWATNGSLTVKNSTISNNGVNAYQAGGIFVDVSAYPVYIVNSTISSNSAFYGGGGVYTSNNPVFIYHSTITQNSSPYGSGGGLRAGGGYFHLRNTIVAQNTAASAPDVYGGILGGITGTYNFIGYDSDLSYGLNNGVNNNIVGGESGAPAANPMLGPLAFNNVTTVKTHALLAGSQAIDKGDPSFNPNSFTPPMLYDERGGGFARVINGDPVPGDRIDIGAFEYAPPPAVAGFVALSAVDESFADETLDFRESAALAGLFDAESGSRKYRPPRRVLAFR